MSEEHKGQLPRRAVGFRTWKHMIAVTVWLTESDLKYALSLIKKMPKVKCPACGWVRDATETECSNCADLAKKAIWGDELI